MTPPLHLTWHQAYPKGPIDAFLGEIEVGSVFCPIFDDCDYFWSCNIGTVTTARKKLRAKSELAAKSALTACVADWLRDAGLQQVPDA